MGRTVTKAEMEGIWQSRETGFLKQFSKTSSKLRKYTVTYKPYKREYLPEVMTQEVWAESTSSAKYQVDSAFTQKIKVMYGKDVEIDIMVSGGT